MATPARPSSLQPGSLESWEYLASFNDLMDAFGPDANAAATHYNTYGYNEGRSITFDAWEYLASFDDLMGAFGADPDAAAEHYVLWGRSESRTITFDSWEYLCSFEDLMEAFGADPDAGAEHYVKYGKGEGRTITFDAWSYLASFDDLMAAFGANHDAAAEHYITYGHAEGRTITFDAAAYLATYDDLQAAFGTDTELAAKHYVQFGRAEGRTIPSDSDTAPPLFDSADVNGDTLVITYTDDNDLDATNIPAAGDFALSGGHNVTGVAVNAAAKTVTLTLDTPVANGEALTLSYTDPTAGDDNNAIQDAAGNDAVSFFDVAVQNNTAPPADTAPPLFQQAAVNGDTLVITYTDDNDLDATNIPAAGDFALSGGHNVTGVAVNAAAKTVTLTLDTPVANGEALTLSYTDPTAGDDNNAIQDAAGNDAVSFFDVAVQNNTAPPADTAPPLFQQAAVNGDTLVITYTDDNDLDATNIPAAGDFALSGGHNVTGVAVNAAAKTVTLTLDTPVANGEALTLSYTDPTAGDDNNAIQDAAGNDAVSFFDVAVQNNTAPPADTAPPLFQQAAVNGDTLVITYTDDNDLDATNIPAAGDFALSGGHNVTGVAVNAAAKTVTLTLDTPVANGEALTLSYTDPTAGDDNNAIQDAAGNDAVSFFDVAVQNNTAPPADIAPPVLTGATVNGSTILLAYADDSNLDNTAAPAIAAYTVSGHTVTASGINPAAKTVILELDTPVQNGDAITISYNAAAAGSPVQDLAGNDAASFSGQAVQNNTPDTTAPVIASAEVNGTTLVITCNELNTLDDQNIAEAVRFSVSGTTTGLHPIQTVAVNALAKTVTLTFANPVLPTETVTLSYNDPTVNNDPNAIQDAAGNDAASISGMAVTNKTPFSDSEGPIIDDAAVDGSTLILTFTDDNPLDEDNIPATDTFTVSNGHIVTGVAVDGAAKTVTLTLDTPVINGEMVTVSYEDPTGNNDPLAIQDTEGNDAESFGPTAVANNTEDITAPVFSSASVNGNTLVMIYDELNNLDAVHPPATTRFAVSGSETGNPAINSVTVNATEKTVTIILAAPVLNGETVTLTYTDPSGGDDSNAIQDTSGNDAVSLSNVAVQNNTPVDTIAPVFTSASVNGTSLVMNYTEATFLDDVNPPANSAFSVSGHIVNGVAVNAAAKTVTLTLDTPVQHGEAVTLSYTDPTAGNDAAAIQDAAGNDAVSLSNVAVQNNTADTTAPAFVSASVNGSSLVLTYTDTSDLDSANPPANSAFSVSGNTVTGVAVNAAAKTVTLTLDTPVQHGEAVTLSYTDPTAGNDAAAIQDAAGNDAVSLSNVAVQNNTADTTAPAFVSASVNGSSLVLTYTDTSDLDSANPPANSAFSVSGNTVTGVAVNAAAKTVTLTLDTPVQHGEAVTLSYTDPTAGNDAAAIQDAAGNDAVSLSNVAVQNNTADTTAPAFVSASVNGSSLVLTYTDTSDLDSANPPANSAFSVSGNTVTGVAVNAAAKTVTLTLDTPVQHGEAVTLSYTDPTAGNDAAAIQDAAGNDAVSLSNVAVQNNTADTTAPAFVSASVNGSSLVLTYTDTSDLDDANLPETGSFTVSGSHAVTGVAVDGAAKTVTLTLGTPVVFGEIVTASYTDPSGEDDDDAIQDAAGNDAASLVDVAVRNDTPGSGDTTAPTATPITPADNATDATREGNLVLSFTENVTGIAGKEIRIYRTSDSALFETLDADDTLHVVVSGSGSSTIVTIDPDNTFEAGTAYYVLIDNGAFEDTAGNPYAGIASNSDWNFTTFINQGTSGNDTLTGSAEADTLNGLAGNDILNGLGGNDTLDGGTGTDTMNGGDGDDTYIVDNGSDTISENPGEGEDTVLATGSYTLPDNVENLTLDGSSDINGTGNSLANFIEGNSGSNTLNGAGGDDFIDGFGGNDTLIGGVGSDTFSFQNDVDYTGTVIQDFTTGTDYIDLDFVDADTTENGDQQFLFIEDTVFSNKAGELRYDGGVLAGDTDGDGMAEFAITLTGSPALVAADIIGLVL